MISGSNIVSCCCCHPCSDSAMRNGIILIVNLRSAGARIADRHFAMEVLEMLQVIYLGLYLSVCLSVCLSVSRDTRYVSRFGYSLALSPEHRLYTAVL